MKYLSIIVIILLVSCNKGGEVKSEYKYDYSKLIGKVWKTGIRQRTPDATMEFYKGDSVCIIGLLRRGGTALFNTTTKNSFGTQLNQIHFLPTLVVVFV